MFRLKFFIRTEDGRVFFIRQYSAYRTWAQRSSRLPGVRGAEARPPSLGSDPGLESQYTQTEGGYGLERRKHAEPPLSLPTRYSSTACRQICAYQPPVPQRNGVSFATAEDFKEAWGALPDSGRATESSPPHWESRRRGAARGGPFAGSGAAGRAFLRWGVLLPAERPPQPGAGRWGGA